MYGVETNMNPKPKSFSCSDLCIGFGSNYMYWIRGNTSLIRFRFGSYIDSTRIRPVYTPTCNITSHNKLNQGPLHWEVFYFCNMKDEKNYNC